jgi:alkanesulfonate monooxygenase SsuD/methylene tetrahydromethanopterin reductase-like flavin-dependent oxidoreductase (luciferase family)
MFSPSDVGQEAITRMRTYAREAGRDPAAIGIEGRVSLASQEPEDWRAQMQDWETLGATHLSVRTDRGAQRSPQEHINALRRFKEVTA